MGFFSDLKEDLSQAVNELMPADVMEAMPVKMEEKLPEGNDKTEENKRTEENAGAYGNTNIAGDCGIQGNAGTQGSYGVRGDKDVKENVHTEMSSQWYPDMRQQMGRSTEGHGHKPDNSGSLDSLEEEAVSVIARGMTVQGQLKAEGVLRVLGSVEGKIQADTALYIAGTLKGDSDTAQFVADHARITGNVNCSGEVLVQEGTVMIGDIAAASAVIAGAVKGNIDIKGSVTLRSTAVVKGDVRCRSVQIENGAVIDGTCSQCYAEVNLEAIFG